MGQRALLYVFRSSGLGLLLAGLLILGGWRLGTELLSSEPELGSLFLLEFLFRLGVTWPVAGAIVPILLWSIRPAPRTVAGSERLGLAAGARGLASLTSMMPVFLAVLALLAVVGGRPVVTWWRESLALIEGLGLWQFFGQGFFEELLAFLPIAGLLFVPAVGSAAVLSFSAGAAAAALFRREGTRFLRIYAAWLVVHAALVLAIVYAADALASMSGPWMDELNAMLAAGPEDQVPAADLRIAAQLRDWIPGKAALTASLAKRLTWISLAAMAWLPVLVSASRARPAPARREI